MYAKKNIVVILVPIVLLISITAVMIATNAFGMPTSMTISVLIDQGKLYNPDSSRVAVLNTVSKSGWPLKLTTKDERKINKFIDLIKNKHAICLSNAKYEKVDLSKRPAMSIDFDESGKLTSIHILSNGRIAFSISKSEYRNKSRLYWLRWKLDEFATKSNHVTYITKPDPAIYSYAKELFKDTRPGL